jgi:predicted FMN-binding regulatory protein PaiB
VARGVVGFKATVDQAQARFKLGQDECDGSYADILAGLDGGDLAAWMRRFNPDRP